jgi:hypothetical protein
MILELPTRPGDPTFISCGRFYLTPEQQAEASCLKKGGVTATTLLQDILLQDPREDPVPSIIEDLSSVRLSTKTT